MSLKDDLTTDLEKAFFNTEDFAEEATLVRSDVEYKVSCLYDEPSMDGESIGAEVEAISHRPRLFVASSALPSGKPMKGDKFVLSSTPFHGALKLSAVDYAFEKDGVVVYELHEAR